jgi:hypothetical protein
MYVLILPLPYNKHIVLNHFTGPQMIPADSDDRMTATHVVLVHWPSVEMVLSEFNSWLCRLGKQGAPFHTASILE